MIELINMPIFWVVLGLVFIALELVLPGMFVIFVGIAAVLLGAIFAVFPDLPIWLAAVVFLFLVAGNVLVGKRFYRNRHDEKAKSLNNRASVLVGASALVKEVRSPGLGTVKLGDTTWRATWDGVIEGGDIVTVESVKSATLHVKK